jgi:formamidopyrimidine-DNA glycosylase
MPELIEIEYYRRLAEGALGRVVDGVDAPDTWFLKRGITADGLRDALVGREFVRARRIGKLLLLDMDDGGVLGLRFGMTGRLVLDDRAGVDDLQYASSRRDAAWDRFIVRFDDGGSLRINDARRLGGVELDPDEARLGADAASITPGQLTAALDHSTAPLKARLMDQHRVAGLGNLLVDEVLWRAGLDPARPAGSLDSVERRRLHRHLRRTVDDLLTDGGSHLGRLQVARVRGGRCPRDGAELERRTVGGRTTYSCPLHQG